MRDKSYDAVRQQWVFLMYYPSQLIGLELQPLRCFHPFFYPCGHKLLYADPSSQFCTLVYTLHGCSIKSDQTIFLISSSGVPRFNLVIPIRQVVRLLLFFICARIPQHFILIHDSSYGEKKDITETHYIICAICTITSRKNDVMWLLSVT